MSSDPLSVDDSFRDDRMVYYRELVFFFPLPRFTSWHHGSCRSPLLLGRGAPPQRARVGNPSPTLPGEHLERMLEVLSERVNIESIR